MKKDQLPKLISQCSHRLHMLNIKSLEYRRLEFDLFFTYKIIRGIVDINFSDFFRLNNVNMICAGTVLQLNKSSTDHLRHFFFHKVPRVWSKLPESVVSAPTFTAVRKRLKVFDLCLITSVMYS